MNVAMEILSVAREVLGADKGPKGLFKQAFAVLRDEIKVLKKKREEKVRARIEEQMNDDLASKGLEIVSEDGRVPVRLGRYRGSAFVTSAPFGVRVADEKEAEQLLAYLQKEYSPKYKLKGVSEEGVASYNVR
jgi:hypothetical protein